MITGQLRREQMQAREFSLAVRFNDFTEVGTSHRFTFGCASGAEHGAFDFSGNG